MIVRCINDKNLIEPRDGHLLTQGKDYELVEVESDSNSTIYWIIDDTKTRRFYDGYRFEPNPVALKRLQRLDIILD
jgi:hypothetical protein